jgi:hypothetical protein
MRGSGLVKALAWLLMIAAAGTTPSSGQSNPRDSSKNALTGFAVGDWEAISTWSENGIDCKMSTSGALLYQFRAVESDKLHASWSFKSLQPDDVFDFQVEWFRVDGIRYEASDLPWRLTRPPLSPDGITVSVEFPLLSVRRDASHEWLPAAYLALPLLDAREFEIGYKYETDAEVITRGSKTISQNGFSR